MQYKCRQKQQGRNEILSQRNIRWVCQCNRIYVPNNKWKENESYIIAKYVESDKVKDDLLKLFK